MAEPKNSGFLSGYAGNPVQRTGRWFVDRIMPGNQRAPDGTLQNVGKGALGLGAKVLAGTLLGPGGAFLVGKVAGAGIDSGGQNWMPYGSGPLANLLGYGDKVGPVTRQQIGFPSNDAPGYAMARPAMNMPTMPAVQAEAPWTGSLAQSNPFGGQYGGNLGFTGGGPRGYGQAAGSFTPNGAGVVQVAGQGFGGQAAAMGFGIGPSSGRGVGAPDLIHKYSRV